MVPTHVSVSSGAPDFIALTVIFPFRGGFQFTAFSVFLICLLCGEKNRWKERVEQSRWGEMLEGTLP